MARRHRWFGHVPHREPDAPPPVPIDLGTECEWFLAGRYEDHLRDGGQRVPAWARLNTVVHGDEADLEALAVSTTPHTGRDVRPAPEWLRAQAAMATELLAMASATERPVRSLQLERLVPLESMLASGGVYDAMPPSQLHAVFAAVLHQHPSGQP